LSVTKPNIKSRIIVVNGLQLEVVRKRIKNLHVGVYPPDGRVRVATPMVVSEDAVRLAVATRFGWIRRQRSKFQAQARQTERRYVSGETHYFQGRPYRLSVIEAAPSWKVTLRNGSRIAFQARSSDTSARERAFSAWYRRELKCMVEPLVTAWARQLGVEPPAWGVRRMRTKWGTCNAKSSRIWINLELAKKPPRSLDYVILHEMAHLLVPEHSDRFVEILDKAMPDWRAVKAELNAEPLAHENWERERA
jgi:predicted metal-dependent hydrolase